MTNAPTTHAYEPASTHNATCHRCDNGPDWHERQYATVTNAPTTDDLRIAPVPTCPHCSHLITDPPDKWHSHDLAREQYALTR